MICVQIFRCPSVRWLSMKYNYLDRLPADIGRMARLEYLALTNNKLQNILKLDQAVGDCYFVCHTNSYAHIYASEGENVYYYYFTERYKSNPWPEWMGTLHGDEILFTFGQALKAGQNFTNAEKELSTVMMKYWTNFAKTG